ncbi:MAG: RNase adapter RapZ [Oscillospiraceae bacterium]|nr:RNase adapter RapZ [Oscillospiraceae bacterium]
MEFLIVSGLSGAGKSYVANVLEDLGYYCVDNMPAGLIPHFAEICLSSMRDPVDDEPSPFQKVALITDVRGGHRFDSLFAALARIRDMNCEYRILFVEARPDAIIRRYKETRRRHPLARDDEPLERTVAHEGDLLEPVRAKADWIVDTTALSGAALRAHIAELLALSAARSLLVRVISFGFKYGPPQEADLMFDVRFLPNPYHIDHLRSLSGLDDEVRDFVMKLPQTQEFLRHLTDMADFLLPHYLAEGKSALVIAVGCTGGQHRSVSVARYLHEFLLGREYRAAVSHRDIGRAAAALPG